MASAIGIAGRGRSLQFNRGDVVSQEMTSAVLAIAQTTVPRGDVRVTAAHANKAGPVGHLSGNVTIETDAIPLHADQADLNENTHEIVAHGGVRVKLK